MREKPLPWLFVAPLLTRLRSRRLWHCGGRECRPCPANCQQLFPAPLQQRGVLLRNAAQRQHRLELQGWLLARGVGKE